MEYRHAGKKNYVLRLEKGEEITAALLAFAEKEKITLAEVSGIGAVGRCEIGVFNPSKQAYDALLKTGDYEITSLLGNLTRMDGKPYQHLHITIAGSGGAVFGGHLLNGEVSLTAELFVRVVRGTVKRRHEDTLGINLMQISN